MVCSTIPFGIFVASRTQKHTRSGSTTIARVMFRAPALLLALLTAFSSLCLAQADLILHHGKIVTMDPLVSVYEAVAIEGGRIAAVGTNEAVLERYGSPTTPMLDLEGRTVLPGLVDSHVHALSAALSEFREPLPPLDSFAAIREYIRKQAKKTPRGQWIVVPRTFPTRLAEMQMPTRELLDAVPNHPVLFDASYTVVVNSYALRISGITRDTRNPPNGEIVKDENGEPNGILKNARGLLKGLQDAESFTPEEKLQALEQMLRRYVAAGLTAVGDRAVDDEQIALYRQLKEQGRLPLRVVMTWRPGASEPFEEIARKLKSADFTTHTGDRWLKFGAYKVTLDGGMTIGTAYQRTPYGSFGKQLYGMTNPDDRGLRFVMPEKLLAIFRLARERGWQLTAHSQGGGAVDAFLDVIEELNRDRPLERERHHLMHASFQSPEAIQRAARLGVLADVQAPWLYFDGPALERVFGPEGMKYFFPLRSYIDAGIIVAGGSDHMIGFDKNKAVNPYNPFFQMWMAITRQTREGTVLEPEQRISREEALRMHTTWAAYMQFAEDERGSIEVGKLADLVVIDRDFLTCPVDEIKDINPHMTIIEGKIIYQR
jgi:predicted amidohydrolase YtcJ